MYVFLLIKSSNHLFSGRVLLSSDFVSTFQCTFACALYSIDMKSVQYQFIQRGHCYCHKIRFYFNMKLNCQPLSNVPAETHLNIIGMFCSLTFHLICE